MGKRSAFDRRERDFYPTPLVAVMPLLSHLPICNFMEPCAGDGSLIRALEHLGNRCLWASDIEKRVDGICEVDALDLIGADGCDFIVTNPPWTRSILHPMIEHFSDMRPTWLLFDADWVHTKQAAPYLPRLRKIVSVGRVKWIEDSPHTGKDNCAWMHFDKPRENNIIEFVGRS